MFADMIPALESAEHFIFIEYFIIGLGRMWGQIHEILVRKAAQGVDVRVIYDDVGSVSVLPIGYWSKLEEEGIHSLALQPLCASGQPGDEQPGPPQDHGDRRPHRLFRRRQPGR